MIVEHHTATVGDIAFLDAERAALAYTLDFDRRNGRARAGGAPVMDSKRIGVLVVADNAAGTVAQVLDRIAVDFSRPDRQGPDRADASQDGTHLVALGDKQLATDLPIEGYGTRGTSATAATRRPATTQPARSRPLPR